METVLVVGIAVGAMATKISVFRLLMPNPLSVGACRVPPVIVCAVGVVVIGVFVSIVMARAGREFFITGHLEYAPNTLDNEYRRDKDIRDDVDVPKNYYLDNNPDNQPLVTWRAHANLLYANWINYYVYQQTPYNIDDIR